MSEPNRDPQMLRVEAAADDIRAASDGDNWAVLDLMGRYREDGRTPDPAILYSGLESAEAAEAARADCIACLLDGGHTDGPAAVPVGYFNLVGRLLKFLRGQDVADAEELADALAVEQPWERPAVAPAGRDAP